VTDWAVNVAYLIAGLLFVFALKWLSHPGTARRGLRAGEVGMLLAIAGTLAKTEIVDLRWIAIALVVGAAIGLPIGMLVPMTAMPQRIALSHAFGALAAALVGTAEYALRHPDLPPFTMGALGFEVLLGFLTFTGSMVAFGKLQGFVREQPLMYRGQNVVNVGGLAAALIMLAMLVADPGRAAIFPAFIAVSLLFGVAFVVRIGGADMPVVLSMLNSLAGLSGAAMGFVLSNHVLVIAGALDGSSGLLLSVIMCRAMNRSFAGVLFGGFGKAAAEVGEQRPFRSAGAEEAAMILGAARKVIVVPGYGMAAAQAQHKVRELADLLERRGTEVLFAIHPVAGRMPGHMNVLLAEAGISYEKMWDIDRINPEFPDADVALVIGANDVVNPAARHDEGSPIYGMPILDADKAGCVMVIKRSMRSGFAGISNELFYLDRTLMLFGDGKEMAGRLVDELAKLPGLVKA
jgi:proton-translocating NAD(P)+ transhydrogenase subunit beta